MKKNYAIKPLKCCMNNPRINMHCHQKEQKRCCMVRLKSWEVWTIDNFNKLHNFGGLHKFPPVSNGNCRGDIYQYCTVHKCGSICGLRHRLILPVCWFVYWHAIKPSFHFQHHKKCMFANVCFVSDNDDSPLEIVINIHQEGIRWKFG